MNNEPVAWMSADGKFNKKETWYFPIPLYTHQYERPHNTVLVPCDKLAEMQAELEHMRSFFGCDPAYYGMTKAHSSELTDEEIIEVWNVLEDTHSAEHDAKVFARAILRKAQEK